MPISVDQREAWTVETGHDEADATFEAVRRALLGRCAALSGRIDVYAHGSHVNRTNTHPLDPLDIVVLHKHAVAWDGSALTPLERAACARTLESDMLSLDEFSVEVEHALRSAFGFDRGRVDTRNLVIAVTPVAGGVAAHVVVASPYRRYRRFRSLLDQEFVAGIAMRGRRDGLQRINFPQHDWWQSEEKDRRTGGEFRRAVRMFKRARAALVARGSIEREDAPSYALESLLSNLPDSCFVTDPTEIYYNALEWLDRRSDWRGFTFQHREARLFGPSVGQWDHAAAHRVHDALVNFWNR